MSLVDAVVKHADAVVRTDAPAAGSPAPVAKRKACTLGSSCVASDARGAVGVEVEKELAVVDKTLPWYFDIYIIA